MSRNNLQNVTVVEAARWSAAGQATIEAHGDPGSARLDFAGSGVRVSLITVDDYVRAAGLSRLDFILIDTEGADFEVLKGAVASLDRFRPAVLAEAHHLTSFGASEEGMRAFMTRLAYSARTLQSEFSRDVLFLPAERQMAVDE